MRLQLIYEDNVSQATAILSGDSARVYELKRHGVENKYLPLAARIAVAGGDNDEIKNIIKQVSALVNKKRIKLNPRRHGLEIITNIFMGDKPASSTDSEATYEFPYDESFITELKGFLTKFNIKLKSMDPGPEASEMDLVATGDNIKVYYADSKAKCKTYGKNTSFCISANTDERYTPHMYDYYRTHGNTTYFVFDNNQRNTPLKIVVVQVDETGFIKLTDENNRTEFMHNDMSPEDYFDYLRSNGVDTSVFKHKDLTGDEAVRLGDIDAVLNYIKNGGTATDEMKELILAEPIYISSYVEITGKRWPQAERMLTSVRTKKMDHALLHYAVAVWKKTGERLREYEPLFLKDKASLLAYAQNVHHRIPEYEYLLFGDSYQSLRHYGHEPSAEFDYYFSVTPKEEYPNGRWAAYERFLIKQSKDDPFAFDIAEAAYRYAMNFYLYDDPVLRPLILRNMSKAITYLQMRESIKRWPELEDLIFNIQNAKKYGDGYIVTGDLRTYYLEDEADIEPKFKYYLLADYITKLGDNAPDELKRRYVNKVKESLANKEISAETAYYIMRTAGLDTKLLS